MLIFTNLSSLHHKAEKPDFFLERKAGYHKYTFVHFAEPLNIFYNDRMITTSPHSAIVYRPGTYQHYEANGTPFVNDFVHFDLNVPDYFEKLQIPLDRPFRVYDGDFIAGMLEKVTWLNSHDIMEDNTDYPLLSSQLLDEMFNHISETYKKANPSVQKEDLIRKKFDAIRKDVYNNPSQFDVQKMADSLHFSRSRFSVLYFKFFNITPQEDLIQAALLLVKNLLATSDLSLNEITQRCGYESTSYLIRLFKRRENITPGQYRKQFKV